jgi:hypothetical protein
MMHNLRAILRQRQAIKQELIPFRAILAKVGTGFARIALTNGLSPKRLAIGINQQRLM